MGGAILKRLVKDLADPTRVVAVDINEERLAELSQELGVATTTSVPEAIADSTMAVLAVKPWVVPQILKEHGREWPEGCLLVSVAAGVKTQTLEKYLPVQVPVVRAMPNTPALIGAGITALAAGSAANEEHLRQAAEVLGKVGEVVIVPESSLDAVTGLSGSGPAYVYMFIEALIDAGVREGLPRETARKLAVETVLGAAKLVKETGEHPAKLKDAVTTPGGTTIAGLAALETGGFRGLVLDAVSEATKISRLLGKDE
ncbi:MAG: pyrroline-5-carboxylate reductase [Firmicutes bacterium]|nr:pyrroline-5-carboxylate reductase [Bacillota bacterium]